MRERMWAAQLGSWAGDLGEAGRGREAGEAGRWRGWKPGSSAALPPPHPGVGSAQPGIKLCSATPQPPHLNRNIREPAPSSPSPSPATRGLNKLSKALGQADFSPAALPTLCYLLGQTSVPPSLGVLSYKMGRRWGRLLVAVLCVVAQ